MKEQEQDSYLIISIHAPREGGDVRYQQSKQGSRISIHAPREGGDNKPNYGYNYPTVFQSTPPARGATSAYHSIHSSTFNFNPRPPRGGRLKTAITFHRTREFQSTPPARGAT